MITTAAEHGPLIHGISLIFHSELPELLGDNHGMLPHTSTPTQATNANLTQSFINHTMVAQFMFQPLLLAILLIVPFQLDLIHIETTHMILDICGSSATTIN